MLNKVVFVRRSKYEKDESKHTEINDVTLELILDLRLSGQERSPVRGVQCTAFDVDRDGWSVLNVANVAVGLNVGPAFRDFAVQGLEIGESLVLTFQFTSLRTDNFRVLRVLPLLRLQFDDLSGQKIGKNVVATGDLPDFVEAPLESTYSANSNVVLGCVISVLVLNGGVLAKDVAIADSINLVTVVAVLFFVFVEPEGESALGIILLHLFARKGNAEKSSEEATDIVGGVGAVYMAHKGWTCQPLHDSLTPFHNNILDSILPEKGKDLLGSLVGGFGGSRIRDDTNPYDDGTETPLLPLSQWFVGEEAGRVDGRPLDLPSLDQVTNLGTDSIPDTIERGAKDSTERLDRDMSEPADWLGEGCSKEIRTVNEHRVVAAPGDAVIVGNPFVLVGGVLRANGGIAGEGEVGRPH